MVSVVSAYAPQSGLCDTVKDKFYDDLLEAVSSLGENELAMVAGDLNGHVGRAGDGYDGVHGGYGFGDHNLEGERILEFGDATGMMVGNTLFKKRVSRLVTYQSGDVSSQIDYILFRKTNRKMVKDVKVIAGKNVLLRTNW